MKLQLVNVVPESFRYELIALLVCNVAGIGLFAYSWVNYGLARSWFLIGIPLSIMLALAFVIKMGRMVQQERNDWKYINKNAFGILFLCLIAEITLMFLAPAFVYIIAPAFLYGLWQLDKVDA